MKNSQVKNLKPTHVNLSQRPFGEELKLLNADGRSIAAIGLSRSGKEAQVTVIPEEIMVEARKNGSARVKIKFDKNCVYLGQVDVEDDLIMVSGEEELGSITSFADIQQQLAERYGRDVRMVRRPGASKLHASLRGERQFKALNWGHTQLSGRFVGNKYVSLTGISGMQYIPVQGIRQMLKGENNNAGWREIQTPDMFRTSTTLGHGSYNANVLGRKDGRVGAVHFSEDERGNITPRYYDAIGDEQIEGTVIGLLPNADDLMVSVDADDKGATITLKRVEDLPENIRQLLQGTPKA